MQPREIEKRCTVSLMVVMGVYISSLVMVLPYNAAAITALNELESESNSMEQNFPHFDVGEGPNVIAVDEEDNIAYVANSVSNTVSIIDADTLKVTTVDVGEYPADIAVDEEDNIAYVANSDSDTVSIIDADTLNITTVDVGEHPVSIAFDILNNKAYVANQFSDNISVINGTDGNYTRMATIRVGVGNYPERVAVNVDSNGVYVGSSESRTVYIFDGAGENYTNIANITFGDDPESHNTEGNDEEEEGGISFAVGLNEEVYVANYKSDMVSVNEESSEGNYTNVANVTVGDGPSVRNMAIDANIVPNILYVANTRSETVSVFDEETLEPKDVGVGRSPFSIAVDEDNDIAYVANFGSDTVSVINGTDGNYTNVANITVGSGPESIAVDDDDNIAYVANYESNTVSVVHSTSQQVQAGVSFDINPFHAGSIECSNITVPTNQYFYVDFRTQCTAQANPGFQFSSWTENLGNNSSRTIRASQDDWFTNALEWLISASSGKPSDTPAILNITKFGSFTANYKELPPAIPPEYSATLFAVVASAFIGSWLTPSFVGWRRTSKQGKKLDYYHEKIKYLYADGKLDKNDIGSLDTLRINITDDYTRGKISKEQFDKLIDDISINYREIFKKEIDSFSGLSREDKEKEVNETKHDLEDAYTKGKISEQYYTLLNNRIESITKSNNNETVDNMKGSSPTS